LVASFYLTVAKRDAAMGGAAFARQPCCLFRFPSGIKASGFAPHPFEWFAFSSFLYPQTCPVKFFAEDERSGFNWGYAD
jgi:hypothetical protein